MQLLSDLCNGAKKKKSLTFLLGKPLISMAFNIAAQIRAECLHAPPLALYAQKMKLWMPFVLKYNFRPCMYCGSQRG